MTNYIPIIYADVAVEKRSPVIGINNGSYAVVLGLNKVTPKFRTKGKTFDEEKVKCICDNIGIIVSDWTKEASDIYTNLKCECERLRVENANQPVVIGDLMRSLQTNLTERIEQRNCNPHNVGMIIIGHDAKGLHMYEIRPNGTNEERSMIALGMQHRKVYSYFWKNEKLFPNCNLDELLKHGVKALSATISYFSELSEKDINAGVVSDVMGFTAVERTYLKKYLLTKEKEENRFDEDCTNDYLFFAIDDEENNENSSDEEQPFKNDEDII